MANILMKNHKLTISFIFLGAILVAMLSFVVLSKAAAPYNAANQPNAKNPYDDEKLGMKDVIELYHKNMNESFNFYFTSLMTPLPGKKPECKVNDPANSYTNTPGCTGKQTPLTVANCLDPENAKNFSTFCVAVNLLGADSDRCNTSDGIKEEGMVEFCHLKDKDKDRPLKGYLNFVAALKKRSQNIFDSRADALAYSDFLEVALSGGLSNPGTIAENKTANQYYQMQKGLEAARKIEELNEETKFAKQALDQTLSAYDQLKIAWPMHQKYISIYESLEKYRDKLVGVRHQTDVFPKKFIDLTTTACT